MDWSSLDAPLRELPVECLVLTGADDAMAEVAAATSANHRAYAARHGLFGDSRFSALATTRIPRGLRFQPGVASDLDDFAVSRR